MTKFFSRTGDMGNPGFYDSQIHGDAIPEDATYVSPARFDELMAAQAAGASIVSSEVGNPVLANVPSTSLAAARAQKIGQTKAEALGRITAIAPLWQQINDLRNIAAPEVLARFADIDAVRAASTLIEAEIAAAPDASALEALAIADNALWPEFN